jgi:hypothetical protein
MGAPSLPGRGAQEGQRLNHEEHEDHEEELDRLAAFLRVLRVLRGSIFTSPARLNA